MPSTVEEEDEGNVPTVRWAQAVLHTHVISFRPQNYLGGGSAIVPSAPGNEADGVRPAVPPGTPGSGQAGMGRRRPKKRKLPAGRIYKNADRHGSNFFPDEPK